MGLLDLFRRTKSLTTPSPYSFLFGLGGSISKSRETMEEYKGWAYACVSAIADEIATIEFRLQKKNGDTWADVQAHPAVDLLNKVNPVMTSDELFAGTSSYQDIEGNAFWYMVRNGKGEPTEIWPLRPDQVE